jgi:hypothetical protein
LPVESDDEQLPPLEYIGTREQVDMVSLDVPPVAKSNGNGNGNGIPRARKPQAAAASRLSAPETATSTKETDRYGIVVFCHLRWGFVWQPQQFLSLCQESSDSFHRRTLLRPARRHRAASSCIA